MNINSLDLDKCLIQAQKAAWQAREILQDYFGKLTQVSEKYQAGLVSEADVESEKAIIRLLKSEFPDFEILGEEESAKSGAQSFTPGTKPRWVIDPLDGTTNYIHRFPVYCISIGLELADQLIIGVVDVPVFKKTYWGSLGRGAYANGERIKVSDRRPLTQSLLATGFSANEKSTLQKQIQIFSQVVNQARGVRRAGSAAYDLCLVAEGVFDAYWEYGLKPWDTAAGALIIKEAGGLVSDYEGNAFSPYGSSVVASNPHIFKELTQIIKQDV